MGFLDWLLGRGGGRASGQQTARVEPGAIDDWVDVHLGGESYFCTYTENGPWLAANQPSVNQGSPTFFLFRNGDLQYAKRITRPQKPDVASNGRVAVPDWHTPDEELIGTLYVFDADGSVLVKHTFDANLGAVAISDDGTYAAAATYSPDCSTYIFALPGGNLLTRHENVDGNKQHLSFEEHEEGWRLFLHPHEGESPSYAIDTRGEVVWQSEALREAEEAERRRQERAALLESLQPPDLIEQFSHEYEDLEGNERRSLGEKLADAHWTLAKNIKKEAGVTDACWSHLNSAYRYHVEMLPWYAGKKGVAKVRRLQGKHLIDLGKEARALALFEEIAELEEEYDVQLLTDADKRKLSVLSE